MCKACICTDVWEKVVIRFGATLTKAFYVQNAIHHVLFKTNLENRRNLSSGFRYAKDLKVFCKQINIRTLVDTRTGVPKVMMIASPTCMIVSGGSN